uniref:uncharacterized protein LOC120326239 n=1 Tax=Styela clava TaxID=7725 RepID=UPI00193929DE|nr:uncharacterized protein LOC120326239 [Styela clava]
MKIICAGLQKTGTKSLAEALRILGYNVHDIFEQFFYEKELWDKVLDNTATISDYQRVLENVDAVTDWPALAVWEQIVQAFPDAKVILTVRSSEDEWYESMKHQFYVVNKYIEINETLLEILLLFSGPMRREFRRYENAFMPACFGVPKPYGRPTEAFLRSRYRQHNAYVKSHFGNGKLLIYNVKQGWEPLCQFLNMQVPEKPFPRKNIKSKLVHDVMDCTWEHDCGFGQIVRRQMRIRFGALFVVLVAILSYFVYLLISMLS